MKSQLTYCFSKGVLLIQCNLEYTFSVLSQDWMLRTTSKNLFSSYSSHIIL